MATADCSVVVVVAADFQWKTRTKNGVFSFFVFFFSGFSSSKPNCVGKQEEIDVAGVASWERRFELPKEKNFCRHGKQKKTRTKPDENKKRTSVLERPLEVSALKTGIFSKKKKRTTHRTNLHLKRNPFPPLIFLFFFAMDVGDPVFLVLISFGDGNKWEKKMNENRIKRGPTEGNESLERPWVTFQADYIGRWLAVVAPCLPRDFLVILWHLFYSVFFWLWNSMKNSS